jgi:hypothetical protein
MLFTLWHYAARCLYDCNFHANVLLLWEEKQQKTLLM